MWDDDELVGGTSTETVVMANNMMKSTGGVSNEMNDTMANTI